MHVCAYVCVCVCLCTCVRSIHLYDVVYDSNLSPNTVRTSDVWIYITPTLCVYVHVCAYVCVCVCLNMCMLFVVYDPSYPHAMLCSLAHTTGGWWIYATNHITILVTLMPCSAA